MAWRGSAVARAMRWLPAVVLLAPWLLGPAEPVREARVRAVSGPHQFRLLEWEVRTVAERLPRILYGLVATQGAALPPDPALDGRARGEREALVEDAVAAALRAAGVSHGLPTLVGRVFPPVLVAMTPPPAALIIAPRDALRVEQSVLLDGGLSTAEQEGIEASADSLGVSSLVTPIGGIATYPAMVTDAARPEEVRQALVVAAHEWTHQYLVFYPLGTGYWASQQTREINESVADLVGQEIGAAAAARLGLAAPAARPAAPRPAPAAFDVRAFLRATRLEVEGLLAAGNIEAAEAYMRTRRDALAEQGYHVRKLNQAYFAFNGSYAEGAAASPRSPVPDLLRRLRARSASVGEFLERVRGVASVAELRAAVDAP